MPSWWMIPTVFLPIAGGMGARLIPFSRRLKQIFLLAVITATSVLTALQIFRGDGNSAVLFSVMDDLTLVFRLDGAGKIFAGLLALLWPPAMLYTYLYMQGRNAEGFFCFYTMSYGVALAIAFAGNLFTLYAFYECLTMVTLPLVAFNKDRAARKAGQTYVNFSITGAAMAFVGMLFLSHYDTPAGFSPGGVLDMARVAGHEEMLRWVFLLAFIGFGTKAAVFPMYAWLPAVSVAPTPVTALLHAVAVVNAGTFAVIRMTHYSFGAAFLAGSVPQAIAVCLSCFTILFAAVMAMRQGNLKKRLAFSTVSNLSYMLLGAVLICLHTPILNVMGMKGESFRLAFGMMLIYLSLGIIRMGNWTQNDTFRAAGDATYGTVLEIVFMWVMLLPLVCVSGLVLKWPTLVVFAFCYADEPIRYVLMQVHLFRGKWIKPVTPKGQSARHVWKPNLKIIDEED